MEPYQVEKEFVKQAKKAKTNKGKAWYYAQACEQCRDDEILGLLAIAYGILAISDQLYYNEECK